MTDDVIEAIAAEIKKRDTTRLERVEKQLAQLLNIYNRTWRTLQALDSRAKIAQEAGERDQVYWQIDVDRIRSEAQDYDNITDSIMEDVRSTIRSMNS